MLFLGVGLGLLSLIVFVGMVLGPSRPGAPAWLTLRGPWQPMNHPLQPGDPILQVPGPLPDPSAGLAPSPLNAFLKPGLTPREQTDIIGQLLLDYWSNLHSLPTGTWEETCAALAGANAKQIAFVERGHPALARDAFRPAADAPGIHIHVISASGGMFQLIHDGPDHKPFTDDDQIRNFPEDLEF
jgi:hypothetical protein